MKYLNYYVKLAEKSDLCLIKDMVQKTIEEIYPHYYPRGAVEIFLRHHCEDNILEDIESGIVYLLYNCGIPVGTVTVRKNEIERLFVLPEYQGNGFGGALLDFAEEKVFAEYDKAVLDVSFSAKAIYLKRGYRAAEWHTILTDNGDYLCYDVMEKENENEA